MNQFIGDSQVVSTNNYNTLRITVTVTHKMDSSTSIYYSILSPQSSGTLELSLALWISDWTNFMRTEYRTPPSGVPLECFTNALYQIHLLYRGKQTVCVYIAFLSNRLFQLVVLEMCFNKPLPSNGFHLCCVFLTAHFRRSGVMSQY
jgi:hypothetical protein